MDASVNAIMNFQTTFAELLREMIEVGTEVAMCATDEERVFKTVSVCACENVWMRVCE